MNLMHYKLICRDDEDGDRIDGGPMVNTGKIVRSPIIIGVGPRIRLFVRSLSSFIGTSL